MYNVLIMMILGGISLKLRNIACFALAAVVAVSLAACKKEEKEQTARDDIASDEYIEQLDVQDFDGYQFRILSRKGMINDQYVEEETGDIVSDAIYRRNETVKSLFNIDIVATESSSGGGETDALNSILAGDDQYDLIFPHSRSAFTYAVQNTLVNYNEVKSLHLDKPWWSKDIVDSCNVNGRLYVLDGDIATHRLTYAFCMYFNKTIFDELGLEYPYDLVLDGEWTFDAFSKLVKRGSKDLNGDGILHNEYDQFGYYTWNWYGPINVLYTGGQRIYSKDARGVPQLTLNSSKTVDIFSKFFDLAETDDVFLFVQMNNESPKEDLFSHGRAMFADRGLGQAKALRSMNDDFGIVPWPKFSQDDEYRTIVNGHSSLMIMPITVEDYERTGAITEALCAIGSRDVIPAFYEVSLKTKFSRDAESEKMIDIIKDSIIYDLGYSSGGTFQSAGSDLAKQNNPDFSSYYASKESAALVKLAEFNKAYGKIG